MNEVRQTPRVTAVLTTYRPVLPYLGEAILSALAQRMPVHVLVSDSGADDSVRAFVSGFGAGVSYRQYGRVLGPAENHRRAIAEVRTPYLALLGHDDLWEPDFLETLVPPLDEHPECILAFSDHWYIDSRGVTDRALTDRMSAHWRRSSLREGRVDDVVSLLAAQAVPLAMAAVVRTDAAQRHPIPDEAGPAYDLWLHYALATEARPYWYSTRRLTRWRFHPLSGTTAGNPAWYRGSAFTWDSVLAEDSLAAIHPVARHRAAVKWLSLAKALIRRGEPRDQVLDAVSRALARERSLQGWLLLHAPALCETFLSARPRRRERLPDGMR